MISQGLFLALWEINFLIKKFVNAGSRIENALAEEGGPFYEQDYFCYCKKRYISKIGLIFKKW